MPARQTEKILEFPTKRAEHLFKMSLDGLKYKHAKLESFVNPKGERYFDLTLRPENIIHFRDRLTARGLGSCPTTCLIYNRIENEADFLIRLRTWA